MSSSTVAAAGGRGLLFNNTDSAETNVRPKAESENRSATKALAFSPIFRREDASISITDANLVA